MDAGEVAATVAIKAVQKKDTGRGRAAPKRPAKGSKERKFTVSGGVVVSVKGRRVLSDAEMSRALEEALEREGRKAA